MNQQNEKPIFCPLCGNSVIQHFDESGNFSFECLNCGPYQMTDILSSTLPTLKMQDPEAGVKISHAVRRMQSKNPNPQIDSALAESIIKYPLPTPREQAENLISWFAESGNPSGKLVDIAPQFHQAIAGSSSPDGLKLVLDYLRENGFLNGHKSESMRAKGRGTYTLSVEGWEYYQTIRHKKSSPPKAFIAMQFGDKDLDRIVDDHFRPVVEACGFRLKRLDDDQPAGSIDDNLRVEISSSDFLIADLSHHNRGAYWEAGYAEGLGKPVIYTCRKDAFDKGQGPHFDTNHHLTVEWSEKEISDACEKLKATIRATLPDIAKMSDD